MVQHSNADIKSTLISRNITVLNKRTSVRLEPEMWRELKNISRRESCSIHDLCSLISLKKKSKTSLTAAIRVFLMLYYRAAATNNGHVKAGHGNFENMKRRAGVGADWSALKLKCAEEQNSSVFEDMDKRFAKHLSPTQERINNSSSAQI
jgi:predicted DNA-binding ribbon-helix-helix protein